MSDVDRTGTASSFRSARAQQIALRATTLATPQALAEIHADTDVAKEVADWLGVLKRLIGVPFAYLVPDEAMLPPETLRFFQVDPNWQYCILEGAYSVARVTSGQLAHDVVVAPKLHAAAHAAATSAMVNAGGQVTGFLLRSGVVTGWPGMKVQCQDATGKLLTSPPLRFECLTPDIMLCMVAGVIARVVFQLPPEGLHFGIDKDSKTGELTPKKALRALDGAEASRGLNLPGDAPDVIRFRAKSRVLKVNATAAAMQAATKARPYTPAEFGVQMVEGVESVTFSNIAGVSS